MIESGWENEDGGPTGLLGACLVFGVHSAIGGRGLWCVKRAGKSARATGYCR
jgi:hypothetical protein